MITLVKGTLEYVTINMMSMKVLHFKMNSPLLTDDREVWAESYYPSIYGVIDIGNQLRYMSYEITDLMKMTGYINLSKCSIMKSEMDKGLISAICRPV